LTKQDTILRKSISPEEKALAFVAATPVALALGILVGSDAKLEALPDGCQVRYMTTKLIRWVWPRCWQLRHGLPLAS
jgi:hypothetical protein